jgi:hypothetical protein
LTEATEEVANAGGQQGACPGSTTWTTGVNVVSPVASCITLTRVAPGLSAPWEEMMNGFHRG